MEVRHVASDDLAARVGEVVVWAVRDAVAARGEAAVAFSGGGTPRPMFAWLADADVPWGRVHVLQVDERVAPDGHGDRNATHLRRLLLDRVDLPPGNVHLAPVHADPLEDGAAAYARTLRRWDGVVDLVHLGLGADGHTASLIPDDPVLDVDDRDVAATGPYDGRRRLTLTFPALDRARLRVWQVTGEAKRTALERLVRGDRSIPAGRVTRTDAVLLHDLDDVG